MTWTHIRPTDVIACSQVSVHEVRVIVVSVIDVNNEHMLDERKAQWNGAIVSTEGDIRRQIGNLSMFSKLGFNSDAFYVFLAKFDESPEIVGACKGSESGTETGKQMIRWNVNDA